jgi:hypothetical protein
MFKKIIKFFRLPVNEKKLFFEAIYLAIWSRIYINLFPFRKFAVHLGNVREVVPFQNIKDSLVVKEVCRAMKRSSRYLPFPKKCLVEAVVAKKMLEKRNIKSTLYLGVSKKEQNEMIAHAWLVIDDIVIVGRQGMDKFVPVEWYT